MRANKSELVNIQALRAAAATMVIFVHLNLLLATLGLHTFGGGGIHLFFVISGFIMVYTTRNRRIPPAIFLRNRITRIVPIYWLITLAVFGVALFAPHLLKSTSTDLTELAKSLLFIPFKKASGLMQPTLFVGWTLNYEMFFYVLFSTALLFSSYIRGISVIAMILLTLTVIGYPLPISNPVLMFYTNPIILEFAFGMIIGASFDQIEARFSGTVPILFLKAVLTACLLVLAFGDYLPAICNWFPVVALCASMAVLTAVILEGKGHKIRSVFIIAVGDASYSLYLTHPFVTQSIQILGRRLRVSGPGSVALMACTIIIALSAALAVRRLLEKPFTKIARDLWTVQRPVGG